MFRLHKLSVALLAILGSQIVSAGPPVAYDGWSVNNGNIDTSVSCGATDVSCRTLATDSGFIYEEVTTPVYSFLRLILTDKDASGNPEDLGFSSEIYTPYALATAGIVQGVASKQVVRDAADNFELTAEVQKSNMRGLNASSAEDMYTAKIDQSFANAEIGSAFSFTKYTNFATTSDANTPDTNVERGRKLDITQSVLIGEAGDTGKQQVFVQRQRSGNAGNGSFPTFLPGGLPVEFTVNGQYFVTSPITTASSMTLPVTENGVDTGATATVNWINGSDIATTWIAQSSNALDGTASVNYQRVNNRSTDTEISALLIDIPEPANPFDWDSNFAGAPSLP